jgi:hypothetical protein
VLVLEIWVAFFPVALLPLWQELQFPVTREWSKRAAAQVIEE